MAKGKHAADRGGGGENKLTQFLMGNLKERKHLENISGDNRTLLH
jgi:hypothetical protein